MSVLRPLVNRKSVLSLNRTILSMTSPLRLLLESMLLNRRPVDDRVITVGQL
jgi:hypothetical protein